jgi:YVTN family beta-propeller protein
MNELGRTLPRAVVLAMLIVSLAGAARCAEEFFVYVSNERSGDVSVIDGEARAVIATWPIGKRPRGIHVNHDGRLLVAVSGSPRLGPGADPERARSAKADKSADGIVVVDRANGRVEKKLSVGSDPEEFALSRDGRIVFVSNEDVAMASAWEIATGRRVFATSVSEEPEGVGLHPTRPEIFVTCEALGEVFVLDAVSGVVHMRMSVGARPRSVVFARDGSNAFVPLEGGAAVAVIDSAPAHKTKRIPIPTPGALPMAAVISPDGRELFVTTGRGNTVAVIDLRSREFVTSIAVGQRPWGIGISPDGRTLFTANGASNDVSVIDVTQRREVKRVRVGEGPWGIAVAEPANPAVR